MTDRKKSPGRPRIHTERLVPFNLYVTPDQRDWLRSQKNASQLLRQMIDERKNEMTTLVITTKWNEESLSPDAETTLGYYGLIPVNGHESDDRKYWVVEYESEERLPHAHREAVKNALEGDDVVVSYHWE